MGLGLVERGQVAARNASKDQSVWFHRCCDTIEMMINAAGSGNPLTSAGSNCCCLSFCDSLAVQTIEFDEGAGAVLRIQPLRAPRDENTYECVARNSEGEVSVTAKLAIIRGEAHASPVRRKARLPRAQSSRSWPVSSLPPTALGGCDSGAAAALLTAVRDRLLLFIDALQGE